MTVLFGTLGWRPQSLLPSIRSTENLERIVFYHSDHAKRRDVLSFLVRNRDKDFTETALAKALGVHKATMNHHVRELEAKGAIARLSDPADARRLIVKPTPGMELLVG